MRSLRAGAVFRTVVVVLSVLAAPALCFSAISQQVPVGPRGIAMGGAFSSIADDATALFWNPAGLARIGHQEITGAHANLFNSGINDNFAAFVLPLSLNHAVAIDWYHSGFDDNELAFGENRIDFAYAYKVGSIFSAGITAKYLTRGTDLDGSNVRRGTGAGLDLGVLATPIEALHLGLVAQDLSNTKLNYSEGGSDVVYPRNVRAGASYEYKRWGTVAFDVDDRWHLGAEVTPIEQVALRAGFEDDREGPERATFTYGAGFKVGVFRFDYALVNHPTLESTNHFGLAMEFNFNPSQVRIEKVAARDLYTSLYKTYAREGIGTAQVRNLQDKALSAKLKVFIPELMDSPSEQDIVLRPKAVQEIPLTAVFPEKVLSQGGDRPIQLQVSASYQSKRLMRTEKSATKGLAYGPGAINWGEGVAQAAAFVTINDPAVDALAREVSRTVALMPKDPLGNRNLSFTAGLLDALATLGVAYVPDPNNPYTSISETPHAVDTIHYPAETLEKRVGDCDDTSVLMAALLGNVGVATKFVDAPGHLFLLVDTGVHERNRLALEVDEGMYVVSDDEVWIPLETTAISKGFAEAWKAGAESYVSWASRGRVALVDVTEAQSRYEPATLPGERKTPALDAPALSARLAQDAQKVAAWKKEYMDSVYGKAPKLEASLAALGEVAHVFFLAGRNEEARAKLNEILTRDPNSAAANNNIAATFMAQGDMARALEHYLAAVAGDPSDPGIQLNLGLARYFSGDTARASLILADAMARSGGYAAACGLLGLAVDESPAGTTPLPELKSGELSSKMIPDILRRAGRRKPLSQRERDALMGTEQPPAPGNLRQAGAPSAGGSPPASAVKDETLPSIKGWDVRSALYWKK